jgi:predicted NAD/FAD-binding protein
MAKDRLAIGADQIPITYNRPATGFEADAQALPKAPGRGWSAWLANVKRRRRLAREERLEWIERLQRLERRKRQSGEYVPDRRHPPHWL